jgi:hypothetical protein
MATKDQRLFITEALPALASAQATSARDMRFSVMHTGDSRGGGATPLGFLLGQLMDLIDQRVRRPAADASLADTEAKKS